MKVEFYRHSLGTAEKAAVGEVLDSIFLTTGPKTRQFEKSFAEYLGVKHCVGMSSCTDGLFLTLKFWGVGPGDRVIVPAMTFVASANVVLHVGADVVFCDVDPGTALIDLNLVEDILKRDKQVRAIIPVHLYGQMVDMKALRSMANQYGVKILEDSAHCIEGKREGIQPGQLGAAAAFSFYATKNMAAGEGGAVASDDERLAEYLTVARLHGMTKSAIDRHQNYQHWDMDFPGYKANMSDIQAALLIPQLGKLDKLWKRRATIATRYETAFSRAGIEFPRTLPGVKNARHLFTIWVCDSKRDEFLGRLQKEGVGVVVNYQAVHLRRFYRKTYGHKEGNFPVAEEIGRRTISIPFYPGLKDEEVDYVIDKVVAINRELCQNA